MPTFEFRPDRKYKLRVQGHPDMPTTEKMTGREAVEVQLQRGLSVS